MLSGENPSVIAPFCGIRYNPERVGDLSRVTAPPYDVISPEFQKALYERDPHNVVRLILGVELPSDTDRENRYTRAAADFNAWLREGILLRDPEPSFYLYEQTFDVEGRGRFVRRGFIALRRIEEYGGEEGVGKIRPHEKTLTGPKADRLCLMKTCGANFSPIFSLYSDRLLPGLLHPFFDCPPTSDIVDENRVRHRMWRVVDNGLFAKVDEILRGRKLFIADGHHRYETAVAYCDWMRGRGGREGDASHYVLMFFGEMSDPGLVVLPIHRVITNWPGFEGERFKLRLRESFRFQTFPSSQKEAFLGKLQAQEATAFGLLVRGDPDYHLMTLKEPIETVDTVILHRMVLRGLLGMDEEEEKDPRYVRFVKETHDAFSAASRPEVNCVFLLHPPPKGVLSKVFETGEVLPPKSTFFYPKLLTGLVMNKISSIP